MASAHVGLSAQGGDAQQGKARWESTGAVWCNRCHGNKGQGGLGADLAGRALTVEQFRRAVRQPWGIMPAFTNEQINDRDTANLVAYFRSLPPVAVAGPYLVPVPPNATKGQQLHIAAVGCGQCHGVLFGGPRRDAGAIDADFAWFAGLAYEHTKTMLKHQDVIGEARTPVRMGNYSRSRLPESVLADIWSDIVRPGFVHRSRRGWVRARTRLTASLTQSLSRIGGCKARV